MEALLTDEAHIIADRGQGLVDLMREGGGELAHAAQARNAGDRLLMHAQLPFGPLLLRHERPDGEPRDRKNDH
ncbi:MAG: hypothetical protein WAL40_03645 [Rhodoplanes sp.]